MTTSFTNRVAQRLQEEDVEKPVKEQRQAAGEGAELVEATEFYGAIRISNSLVNVELYLSNGSRAAVPCSYMTGFRFPDPSEISFRADGEKYTITGRNLEALWIRLIDHRLKYIKANIGNDLTPDTALFVRNIDIHDV